MTGTKPLQVHFAQRLAALRGKSDASIARMIRHAQGEGLFVGSNPELTAISIAAVLTDTTAYWFRHRAAMEARGIDQHCALAHLLRVFESMLEPCEIEEIAEFGVVRHIG